MSETKHTPEPWEVRRLPLTNGQQVAIVVPHECGGFQVIAYLIRIANAARGPNAERIVACVNACAGMSDPAAEIARLRAEDHPGPHEKNRILAELTAQRDVLLAALQHAETSLIAVAAHITQPSMAADASRQLPAIRSALEMVEGKRVEGA